jgi:hypothetical protein
MKVMATDGEQMMVLMAARVQSALPFSLPAAAPQRLHCEGIKRAPLPGLKQVHTWKAAPGTIVGGGAEENRFTAPEKGMYKYT